MWLQSPRVSAQQLKVPMSNASNPKHQRQKNIKLASASPTPWKNQRKICKKKQDQELFSYLLRAVEPWNDILNSSRGACSAQVPVSTPARKTSVQWIIEVQEVCPWKSLHHVRHSACMLVSSLVRLFCHGLKNFRDSTAFLYVQNLRHTSHPWALQPTCDVHHNLQPSVPSVLNRGEY